MTLIGCCSETGEPRFVYSILWDTPINLAHERSVLVMIGICKKNGCNGAVVARSQIAQHSFCPDCGETLIFTCANGHEIIKSDQQHCTECGEELRPNQNVRILRACK